MSARRILNRLLKNTDYSIEKVGRNAYSQDGLITKHNHDFMQDSSFRKAFARGVLADGEGRHHWRVHIGLWAASLASRLDGDFVECGVNRGFLSSAIMEYLDWDILNKKFYLLDTFSGVDERYLSEREIESGRLERARKHALKGDYIQGVESVQANFSEWVNVSIIQGPVPDTLDQVSSERVAYLHLDMNCAEPEVAAFNYFWEKLVQGAIVLLDDYGFQGYEAQKDAMDAVALKKGVKIASLPTGQGLIIKI
jgi:hypothetical protein